MDNNISFDVGALETLVGDFDVFKKKVADADNIIKEQIGIINTNWSGPIHDTAKADLDNIENAMPIIENNANAIYNILAEVSEGFKNTKY